MPYAWRPVFVTFQVGTDGRPMREVVRLPSNIKKVSAIKLCGQSAYGLPETEAVAMLDIKEARTNNDELLTNQEMLNSTFYPLQVELNFLSTRIGRYDFSHGLRCSHFTPRNMPTLTFELKNAVEGHLNYGGVINATSSTNMGCHLWLQIMAECD